MILIVGDSLSAPRSNFESIVEWPALIRLDSVTNLSRPFLTSDSLKSINCSADIIIINVGLVDCAERTFSKFEHKLLSFLPAVLRSCFISGVKRKPCIKMTSTTNYVYLVTFRI